MLDKKDLMIIELLKEDGKLTTSKISKKTLLPITTIHNRIKKLQRNEVIKNYTINLDNKKMGKFIEAYVFINLDYQKAKKLNFTQLEIIQKIKENPSVEMVNVITGIKDLVIKVVNKDIEELNNSIDYFLDVIPAIKQIETSLVLH